LSGNCAQTCGRNVAVRAPMRSSTPSSCGRSLASKSSGEVNASGCGSVSTLISIRISSNSPAWTGGKRPSRSAALRAFSATARCRGSRAVKWPMQPRSAPPLVRVTKQARFSRSFGGTSASATSGRPPEAVTLRRVRRASSSRNFRSDAATCSGPGA